MKLRKIGSFFKKLPRVLGENSFLTFLGLLFVSLVLGALVFYKFSFSVGKEKPEITEESLRFQEKTYQAVSDEWQKRDERLSEINLKLYPDPFVTTTSTKSLTK